MIQVVTCPGRYEFSVCFRKLTYAFSVAYWYTFVGVFGTNLIVSNTGASIVAQTNSIDALANDGATAWLRIIHPAATAIIRLLNACVIGHASKIIEFQIAHEAFAFGINIRAIAIHTVATIALTRNRFIFVQFMTFDPL